MPVQVGATIPLAWAETGISDALSDTHGDKVVDREKFRVLAKAYKKVKAENRALKAGQRE